MSDKEVDQEIELKKYGMLFSYLQYENSSFWNRNNFFLVAHAALLGFLIPKLPKICPATSWENIIIPFVYSIAGLLLSLLWRSGLEKSRMWIDHWRGRLEKLKEGVWDKDFDVFPKDPIGAIKNAYHVVWLFGGLWTILIFYFLFAILMKLCPLIC